MYSSEVRGAPQKPDLLLRSYMVGQVLLRPSPPTIQHIYTYQIMKSVQPTGYDALFMFFNAKRTLKTMFRNLFFLQKGVIVSYKND